MIVPLMLTAVLALSAPDPAGFFAGNDQLRAYLLEAGEHSLELQARYAEWEAALARVPQAGALEDPQFTYAQFLQSDALRARFALSQRFPWFGTREARRRREAAQAEAALQAFYAARNRVLLAVKQAYFDWTLLEQRIEITRAQYQVVLQFRDLVKAKLALGLASEDELLRVGIAETQLKDRLDALEGQQGYHVAALNAAMGVPAETARPSPQPVALPSDPPALPAIRARIRETNPDVAVWEAHQTAQEEAEEVARREGLPSIRLGFEYTIVDNPDTPRPDRPYPSTLNAANRLAGTATGATPFSAANLAIDAYSLATSREPITYPNGGDDNVVLTVGISVPLWRKRVRASIEEAQLRARAAERRQQREALDLDAAAEETLYQLSDAARRYATYKEALLPQANLTYESLSRRYATGLEGADFLDLLDVLQQMLSFELEAAKAERDRQAAAAELEFLVGGSWAASSPSAQAKDATAE